MQHSKIGVLPLFEVSDNQPRGVDYEKIIEEYAEEFKNLIVPKGDTVFGFWMQTLADLELLDLELQGLTDEYFIDPIARTVEFKGNEELLRKRIAHLEKVRGKNPLYTELVDAYGDTNAYAFHNLYPYKGKFYPRVVRTLINAFKLTEESLILLMGLVLLRMRLP